MHSDRQTDRHRQTDTDRHRHRQTQTHTDTDTDTQTQTQTHTHRHTYTHVCSLPLPFCRLHSPRLMRATHTPCVSLTRRTACPIASTCRLSRPGTFPLSSAGRKTTPAPSCSQAPPSKQRCRWLVVAVAAAVVCLLPVLAATFSCWFCSLLLFPSLSRMGLCFLDDVSFAPPHTFPLSLTPPINQSNQPGAFLLPNVCVCPHDRPLQTKERQTATSQFIESKSAMRQVSRIKAAAAAALLFAAGAVVQYPRMVSLSSRQLPPLLAFCSL